MKKFVLLLVAFGMTVAPVNAQSGFASLFDSGSSSAKGTATAKKPTTIDSLTMDADMNKNITIFIGNVVVDTPSMHITCQRMELYLQDSVVNGKKKKEVKEIHCFKNRKGDLEANDPTDRRVVIIKKAPGVEDYEDKNLQRSFSGKAVYNMKTGKIVLTDDPVLIKGMNEIHGTKIIIWRDSDVMNVENGHIKFIDQNEDQ